MPKEKVATENINPKIFKAILKAKGYNQSTLIDLITRSDSDFVCSQSTLQRSLRKGEMREQYLLKIAKLLDVDPRYLKGDLFSSMLFNNEITSDAINYYVSKIDNYPYSRMKMEEILKKSIQEHLTNILGLFSISYSQFEELDFETQYNLQHDLFEGIESVIVKYFNKDGFGNPNLQEVYALVASLEAFYEQEMLLRYADSEVRDKFTKHPPKGYTSDQIKNMTRQELLDLDVYLELYSDDEPHFSRFHERYNLLK